MSPAEVTTVVVVDDNNQIRELVKRTLKREGYEVLDWADPRRAIEHLESKKEPLGLAIVDGVMPEMLGPSVAAEIDRLYPGLPIMLMSGHEAPMFRDFFDRPNRHFIAKPFVIGDLIQRIRAIAEP